MDSISTLDPQKLNMLERDLFQEASTAKDINFLAPENNCSLLHRAILGRASFEFVRWLVCEKNAHVSVASGFFSHFITQHLSVEFEKVQAIHLSACFGDEEIFYFLLQKGADVNSTFVCFTSEEWSTLDCASKFGHLELYYFLIQEGAVIPKNPRLLHVAAGEGHPLVATAIIGQSIVDINFRTTTWWGQKDNIGNLVGGTYYGTALLGAIMRGNIETVQLLVCAGISVNLAGNLYTGIMGGHVISQQLPFSKIMDITPLHLAAYRGIPKIVELLLNEGANQQTRCAFDWLKGAKHPLIPYEVAKLCADTKVEISGGPLDSDWEACLALLATESNIIDDFDDDECAIS